MDKLESKPDRPKRIFTLVAAALLFALAIFLWVKWVHELWPMDTSHTTGSAGAFLIYFFCRFLSNVLVLAAPLGATAIGFFCAIATLGSGITFIKRTGVVFLVLNGICVGALLIMALHNVYTGFTFN